MEMSQVVKELQDAVIVLSEFERRQSAALDEHREWLQEHDKRLVAHIGWLEDQDKRIAVHRDWLEQQDKRIAAHSGWLEEHDKPISEHSEWFTEIRQLQSESVVFQKRTDQNLAEITDKLNGLIGYMDGTKH